MPDSNEYLAKRAYVDTQLAQKQDTLIAGQNITIGADGKTISATGGGETYTAGTGISISQQNEIELSAQTQLTLESLAQNKQNKLTAGPGITIDEHNVISATGGPTPTPTDLCIKTYTATDTTDTHGYFAIDLQSNTVDPENIFSVVAAENQSGNVCTGLVWDSNGILNGIYMTKSVNGSAVANASVSYTVFYYDDTVTNGCVNTYTVTHTTSAYGNIAIDLQNGDIDPFSIFAVTVDSSSSTSDVLCSGVHWWTDGNPKTIDAAFMHGNPIGSIYSEGQITYKVFYYTESDNCVKTINTNISTSATGEGNLPIGPVDPNKVFSVIMTDDLPAGSSGDETMSRGLVLSSNSISGLFANGWQPTTAKSNITFPATIFYLDDGGVVPPEPSKQEVITHTTAEWAQLTSLVSEKDVIYIWSDYKVKDGTPIPAMKVGDGDAYVLDLPFATQAITEDDIAKWDTVTSKVSARVEGNVLILE